VVVTVVTVPIDQKRKYSLLEDVSILSTKGDKNIFVYFRRYNNFYISW